jgi:PRTRC genetic system protein E
MITFLKALAPVLNIVDLKFVIAKDGNNISLMVLPKTKNSDSDMPSLNMTFDITKGTDEELAEIIVEKLNRSLPTISNINAFQKALEEKQEQSKKEAAKPAPKGKTSPYAKPAPVKKEEEPEEEEESEKEEQNEDPGAEAPAVEQAKLF